jgi:ABC-type branched-subunit amino acid transport system substrate-binding protein
MRTTIKIGAAVAASALVLTACSSGESEEAAGSAAPSASAAASCEADGILKLGTILPQTGNLAFLGPPEFAGVELAVQEINDAGGVLGKPVELFNGDSGDTTTNIAVTTADEHLQRGVDAVIGAASSGVSLTFIDKVTGAGVLHFSPANTSPAFTTYDDNGLYFRTAPSDLFQGAILAEQAANAGFTKPAVLALQDAYGEGLANAFAGNFTAAGGSLALDPVIYDPQAASFEAEVGKVKATDPDAVVLIGFDESQKVIQELIKQGIGPDKVQLYLVDGNLSNKLAEGLPEGILEGTVGTLPGAKPSDELRAALLEIDPDLVDFSYAPESYDAVMAIALGAELAKSDCATDIAAKLVEVTNDGAECTTFADCKAKIDAGEDFDFNGQSGPIALDENGDPSRATMGVYVFGADNQYTAKDFIEGDVPAAS